MDHMISVSFDFCPFPYGFKGSQIFRLKIRISYEKWACRSRGSQETNISFIEGISYGLLNGIFLDLLPVVKSNKMKRNILLSCLCW